MPQRLTYPIFKAFTQAGFLADGYKIYTYDAGTSTPRATYSDFLVSSVHTNPIILSAIGESEIFIDGSTRIVLTDEGDVVQPGFPVDINYSPLSASDISVIPSGDFDETVLQDLIDAMIDTLGNFSNASYFFVPYVSSSIPVEGLIWGGDITKTGDHGITVKPISCMDSTWSKQLHIETDTVVTVPTAASTLYHVFVVRLVADGSHTIKLYHGVTDVASDATVSYYRRVDFWKTNGASNACDGASIRGIHWNDIFSENAINSAGLVPENISTAIDISTFIPVDFVYDVMLGGQASSNTATVAVSGVSGHAQAIMSAKSTSSGEYDEWGSQTGFIQLRSANIYWGLGGYTQTGYNVQLAIHAVRLRR